MRKYQVFISSTFSDLKEERQCVQEMILKMNHFPVGMELFSAADEDQWSIIKQTIDSSDYYILIIAYRYGTISDRGVSYTQKEFEYAKKKGIPVLAFIKREGLPVSQDEFEFSEEKRQKLSSFIGKVKTGRLVEWWTSKEDLCQKIMNALYKQFDSTPRPGWIRADSTEVHKMQTELIKQNKRIRALEEVNSFLQTKLPERLPNVEILINQGNQLDFLMPEWLKNISDSDDYVPFIIDTLRCEGYSEAQLSKYETYNKALPEENLLKAFLERQRISSFNREGAVQVEIAVNNRGTAKATNIFVEVVFPQSLLIYDKDNICKLDEPDLIQFGMENENTQFEMTCDELNIRLKNVKEQFIAINGLNSGLDSLDWIENNILHIYRSEIMHTRSINLKSYYVIPLVTGEFEIQIRIICEEYARKQKFIIPVKITSSAACASAV